MADRDKLFLLDGTALAYRAYFAFINSNLKNAEGLPTGTVFGFANTIERLLEKEKPTHIAVAWDTHAPTFRHEMDKNYKANRPPQPEDLRAAMPVLKDLLALYNIPVLEQDGYEADDILGTLAHQATGENVDVFLVTPDKDYMQLICDNVSMYKPLNNGDGFDFIDREGVIKYFGVPPEKVIDVLAIIGDTSDNIPGVPGVGKKTAPKIIEEYGSLEAAIEDAPNISSKRVREGLMNNADQARLSRKMIIIKTDVPNTPDWKEFDWSEPKTKELGEFYQKMEFKGLTRKYAGEEVAAVIQQTRDKKKAKDENQVDMFGGEVVEEKQESPYATLDDVEVSYSTITDLNNLKDVIKEFRNAPLFCFDTETTGTDTISSTLLGLALSKEKNHAYYIPFAGEDGFKIEDVKDEITELFNGNSLKIAHNFKYDYSILKQAGIPVRGTIFDTMLAAYLLDNAQKFSMDKLAERYLEYSPISIESLIGAKGKNQKTMSDLPLDIVSKYACEDADITYQLYKKLKPLLENKGMISLSQEIEFPLARVIGDMELNGVQIDVKTLNNFSAELNKDLISLEEKIFEAAGESFNINSTKQLGEIMFGKLKLPTGKKTSTGKYSTNEQVLTKLAATYEFPAMILDYRSIAKLKSTYVDSLPKLVHPQTGRIHSSFNQHVTATGRLSSSNPNMQNIPIRTERSREIRKAFTAPSGSKIIAADYSQVELRIIASISGDEAMKQAFINGEDIHARTAKEIFQLETLDEVTRDQRRKAKEVNFGIPYGVSAFGLAQRLGIGNNEGKAMIDAYFERFPKIKTYIEDTVAYATEHGYVETLSGRRRDIPDILSRNRNVKGFAERTAINMPIQGTAADLIKIAMLNVASKLEEHKLKTKMIMQVHDELVFEAPEQELEEISKLIVSEMENAMKLDVPLKVELNAADNWMDAH